MSEPGIGSDNGRGEGPATVSVGEAEEIDRLCDRFEAAWRSGGRPRFEDHLPFGDGPFRAALKAELIAIELEWRRRREGLQPRADRAGETGDHRPPGRGVLETLSASVGAVPHVLLRDTDGGPEPPLHRPGGGDPGQGTRYRIDGEIARGGMGAVLKGRDPDLGRDVALKVLREDFRDDADMVRRFVEEAQIGGQLQHPGVVPIYEMGTLGDRRPFFSMKLVNGDTLARLLAARKDPRDGLPRLLTIFEAAAQTVAYAHARGVIHRDLKPSNVMVGAFGEVQVMDWGLAKVLARGGVTDDAEAGKVPRDETVIATARSGSADSDLSKAGSVLGTPSYMAPEQARGEIEHVDERADVFALGSILCEILTDQPAFVGRNSGEIQRSAALGDTAGALARLDACGADADLISLAKDCLAREAQDRPATAGAVSDRVTAYLAGVQDRLRRAELERVEERARRRVTTVVAASLILLGLLGGGGYAWNQRQRADRLAKTALAVDEALSDAARLLGEARSAPPGEAGRWSAAEAAAKRVEGLLAQSEADELLRRRVDSLASEVESGRSTAAEKARQIEVDRVLLEELESVRGSRVTNRDLKRTDAGYAEAFRKAGLDLDATRPDEAGKWLASRTDPVELAGYLDDWAFVRRAAGRREADWRRLVAAARGGTPSPGATSCGRSLGTTTPRRWPSCTAWPEPPGWRIRPRRASSCWPVSSSSDVATASGPRRSCGGPPAATRATSGSISSWPAPSARRWKSAPMMTIFSRTRRRLCDTWRQRSPFVPGASPPVSFLPGPCWRKEDLRTRSRKHGKPSGSGPMIFRHVPSWPLACAGAATWRKPKPNAARRSGLILPLVGSTGRSAPS